MTMRIANTGRILNENGAPLVGLGATDAILDWNEADPVNDKRKFAVV